jgi:hypothetical protein
MAKASIICAKETPSNSMSARAEGSSGRERPARVHLEYGARITGSLLKLEGLYFINPAANRTAYVGGGLSWGGTNFGNGWNGSGLQGELTVGYELPRASTLRVFVQADAILPFYNVSPVHYPAYPTYRAYPIYPRQPAPVSIDHRYAPSFVVSLGLGWQKSRSRRQ